MLAAGSIAFLLVKLLAYTAWCGLGLRLLAPGAPSPRLWRSLRLALLRLGLGLALGWLLVLLLTQVAPEPNRLGLGLPSLLFGFVVLRWLEWSFLSALILGDAARPARIVTGRSATEHLWRLGGLLVSFATDFAGVLGVGALGLIPC